MSALDWVLAAALVLLGGLGLFWAWSVADAASFGDEDEQ